MKISIITVCFNAGKTIRKTIESVVGQSDAAIEYIIVDGGSNDNTMEIVNEYAGQVTKIVTEQDEGLYDAMNKGIRLATGDYIGILNADDVFWSNNTIKKIAAFLNLHPGIDAVTGDIVQTNGKRIVRKYSSQNWNPNKLKIGFMPPHPSIFFKRELFDKFGLYSMKYPISSDYELIVRFFLKHKISFKYSGITSTSMLIGGASSSGVRSYLEITRQICQLLTDNNLQYSPLRIRLRFVWKILEYFKR